MFLFSPAFTRGKKSIKNVEQEQEIYYGRFGALAHQLIMAYHWLHRGPARPGREEGVGKEIISFPTKK